MILILNRYAVIHYFNETFDWKPQSGVIEPVNGKLYGTTSSSVYSYDFNTEVFNFLQGHTLTDISGELMKASDGFLYGTTKNIQSCPGTNDMLPNNGTIFRVNMETNSLQTIYRLRCDFSDGAGPTGSLVEVMPGKLYGTTFLGGIQSFPEYPSGRGALFEYDIRSNIFTKKVNFNGDQLGMYPSTLVHADDKLYGVCFEGGITTDIFGTQFHTGTLFKFDPVSSNIVKLHDFGNSNNTGIYPISIIQTTNGYFAGTKSGGFPFRYNPSDNSVVTTCTSCAASTGNFIVPQSLTEICRKPAYHFFETDTFDACANSNFSYDIQNTNATSFQWLKDGDSIPNQTTGILNLTSLVASDAGNYMCIMTNECGSTTTMPLHLTVNCLGTSTVAKLDKSIKLYPNPANTWINIELPKNIDITVSSCSASNLLDQNVFQSTTAGKIDISQLQNGIYIISLQTNYGKWNGKFIKE